MSVAEIKTDEIFPGRRKISSYIGLARRSGKYAVGSDRVLDAVRKSHKGDVAVVLGSDSSDRTKKQIRDKCGFYSVPLIEGLFTSDEISAVIGSGAPVSAVALTDRNIVSAVLSVLSPEE